MKIKNTGVFVACCLSALSTYAGSPTDMIQNRTLGDGNWGTHMAPLVTAVVNTQGSVLEFGCGDYSTPLLHAICTAQNRFLLSAESDEAWLRNFLDLATDNHLFKWVSDIPEWDSIGSEQSEWDVIFIDHAPARRRIIDIERLRNRTTVFVVHDTEQPLYGYEKVFKTFKYRFDYKRYKKRTTVLSDTVNVSLWFK